MRELHVVAVSEDGRHVLLAGKRGATTGGFRVALDDRLQAAVRGDLPKPGEDPHAAPDLSPKEIQARLRAGESAASIALSAGVPVTRVERFAGPVQGEMARIVDATRAAHLVRGRLGRSVLSLGAAVDAALAAQPTLRPESVDWQTHRLEDGTWRVTVAWFARARTRTAAWTYDPVAKTVTAVDPASAALAHSDGEPAPVRRTAGATAPATAAPAKRAAKAPAKKAAAKKAPAKKAAVTRAPAEKVAATKFAAKKASAKKAAVAKAPLKKAPVKKAPAEKTPASKAPAKKAPVAKAPVRKAAAKAPTKAPAKKARLAGAPAAKAARTARTAPAKQTAPAARRALRVVPDPEPAPTTRRTAADRDGVKTRASVPAWADVLLGTSPGGDR